MNSIEISLTKWRNQTIVKKPGISIEKEKFMNRQRLVFFDSLRGLALIIMAIYHFCFDLNQFGILHQNMDTDDFWLNFRALIMTLFLGVAGVSIFISKAQYRSIAFQQRLKKIALCAALISLLTYIMNSQTWVFFGVLHFILVASLLGPILNLWPWLTGIGGVFLIALPLFYRHMFFNQPILILTGLSPIKPMTEDFSPFTPWLGVVSVGILLGYLSLKWKPNFLQREIPFLSLLGRRSLLFYMTHQLILYPLAWTLSQIIN